ncbi:MAG: LPS translocon maturation chaperone LptM [Quisquiliibacterium sp.]
MKRLLVGAAILAALIGTAACGQRGPLYLPRIPPAEPGQITPPQPTEPSTRR